MLLIQYLLRTLKTTNYIEWTTKYTNNITMNNNNNDKMMEKKLQ